LIADGRVFGIYSLDKAQTHFFTEAHLRLAEGMSAQGAIAIHNARLFEQVRAGQDQLHALSQRLVEVQEEERRHLARELHDEVGQMLTGLKLMLGVLPRLPSEALNDQVAEATAVLNSLTEQVHTLALNLRPVILDDLGLTSALLWLFERFTARTGVQVNFESVGLDHRFPATVETTAYRIVQEALTNVARHAGVAQASVRIRVEADQLRVQIQDSGRGFETVTMLTSRQRAGLAGMRERAALLGGQLQVDSAPGTGTQVIVTLPIG
jgi:signal transduction histidine kinase